MLFGALFITNSQFSFVSYNIYSFNYSRLLKNITNKAIKKWVLTSTQMKNGLRSVGTGVGDLFETATFGTIISE